MGKRVGSRRRAGRAVRRQTRHDQWREIRQVWWRLLVLVIAWVPATIGLVWIQRTDFLRGLVVGAMAMGYVLMVYAFLAAGRTVHFGMGAEAERWTTDALRKLGSPWRVIDDVSFSKGNVDHVLIGPSSVYALETKYMSSADDRRLIAAGRQASEGARRIQRLLRSEGVERDVVPVVVIWGRGRRRLGAPYQLRDGVRFVSGPDRSEWLDRLRRSADGEAADIEVYDALVDFVKRREVYEARRSRGGLWRFVRAA